jgi:uncharacterized protein YndB with AHSA1/START domain
MDIPIQLQCSPTAAFRSWTDPEEILRWWGAPGVYRVVAWEADVVEGGTWRAGFEGPDGAKFGAGGTYMNVCPPAALDWTWQADWDPGTTTVLHMTFAARDGGTVLTLRSDAFPDRAAELEAERGWREIAGWLQDHHASEPQGLA